jgi:hypothetical protein
MSELLQFYGVSAIIAGLIATLVNFAFKAWIDHQSVRVVERLRSEYARDLEALRSENERALEAQRALLAKGAYKHTRLHDLRLSTIEEVMLCIGNLELALNPLVGIRRISGDDKKDKEDWQRMVNEAAQAYNKFLEISMKKTWYLPETAIARIFELRSAALDSLFDIEHAERSKGADPKFVWGLYKGSEEKVRKVIPAVRAQLEADFRALLADD